MAEKMSDERIAKLEAAGAKRGTKYDKDRMYIDVTLLGADIDYYKSGNFRDEGSIHEAAKAFVSAALL